MTNDKMPRGQAPVPGGRTERIVLTLTSGEAARLRGLAERLGVTVQRLIADTMLENDITSSRVVAQEVAAVRRLLQEDTASLAKMANSNKWDRVQMDRLSKGIDWRNQALSKYGMGK